MYMYENCMVEKKKHIGNVWILSGSAIEIKHLSNWVDYIGITEWCFL